MAGLLLGGSFFAFIFVGTLYMQDVLHYSALQTGVAWLAEIEAAGFGPQTRAEQIPVALWQKLRVT